MEFCAHCDNMMYTKLDDETNLVMYCKNCGFENKKMKDGGSHLLIHDNKVNNETRYSLANSEYIVYDPTLPHVNNIECPNKKCTRGEKDNDVIYKKYDFNNMKYLYHCVYCKTVWKSD